MAVRVSFYCMYYFYLPFFAKIIWETNRFQVFDKDENILANTDEFPL